MKLFNDIHEEQYRYFSDPWRKVAAYAHRIIRLRDGWLKHFKIVFRLSGLSLGRDYILF
jgi:hypothetical protein